MKTNIKKTLITIATTLSAILIVSTATYAIGTLTPSGTAGDDTQYSLNDIYDKLTNFSDTPNATSSPFTVPSVSASFNTLSEIYGLLQAEEADLVAGNIKDGVTVFGVEGSLEEALTPIVWASANSGAVSCSLLVTDSTQPEVTLDTICSSNSSCTWTGSACTGTIDRSLLTWYAAKAACANSTLDGHAVGYWRMPTYVELASLFFSNDYVSEAPPLNMPYARVWTSNSYDNKSQAYYVDMGIAQADYTLKSSEYNAYNRCVH